MNRSSARGSARSSARSSVRSSVRSSRAVVGGAVMLVMAAPVAWGAAALVTRGPLADLQPAVSSPFDSARAQVALTRQGDKTTTVLTVHGIGAAALGHTYGAHLHEGVCRAGDGAAALGHYNHTKEQGLPVVIDAATEIWLDFTVVGAGEGRAVSHVPFAPTPAARSVVIHAQPTDPITGTAGARLACLPVQW